MQRTLGGDRLGSGKKMKVEMKNYERSTHDLSHIWKSTVAPGTLVPFFKQVGLPGDTWDIDLDAMALTLPTIGPLFGSYKLQCDMFMCPMRLYNSWLHNNKINIGMKMNTVLLPKYQVGVLPTPSGTENIDISQVNPSALLAYLGVRGFGINSFGDEAIPRLFQAIPLLAYWEIYRDYYSNKQEEIGAYIGSEITSMLGVLDTTTRWVQTYGVFTTDIPYYPNAVSALSIGSFAEFQLVISLIIATAIDLNDIMINTLERGWIQLGSLDIISNTVVGTSLTLVIRNNLTTTLSITSWNYLNGDNSYNVVPQIQTFPLSHIDDMKDTILQTAGSLQFLINEVDSAPYNDCINTTTTIIPQQGLALKTYQSDKFNNWVQTEWIDGTGGVNELSSIDVSGGTLNIDSIILGRKVYNLFMRIAVSGGTYDDWLDVVYTNERYGKPESPVFVGGISKEINFQAVVSLADSNNQPLGTLAGRGVMNGGKKGGMITIKCNEPCYLMGIASITPRLDYSQGNDWDSWLNTIDDLHKPELDQIGFEDLIAEQMYWITTSFDGSVWSQMAVGKQPAWINYMTEVNKTFGNFAISTSEMFMTLNRRYENDGTLESFDLTTYIEPTKFNFIFAQTNLTAQNFWLQIAINAIARRKMSAKQMPNL